jgi:hypothetical protein
MHSKAFGHFPVDGAQKDQELLVPVFGQTRADARAGEHVSAANKVVVP